MQKENFILMIDTTQFEQAEIVLKTADDKVLGKKRFTAGRELSQKLLPEIIKFLRTKRVKPADLTAIEVTPGPGSFTGTRIGVAVANALAFSLGIPVNGKEIVTPVYSSPPKITLQP